jgi:hypothetical protein
VTGLKIDVSFAEAIFVPVNVAMREHRAAIELTRSVLTHMFIQGDFPLLGDGYGRQQ